jgi:hypothetical protein
MAEQLDRARAGQALMRDKDAIASAVTERLYAERPYLLDKHGERGRGKTLQDMRYNIEHLIPAVDLGDPQMFARYVEWLDNLLRSRNVETKEVVRCLELLTEECEQRMPQDTAAIRPIIDAGLAVVVPA